MKRLDDLLNDFTLVIWGFMITIIYGLASIAYARKGKNEHDR
jgi:hypothetical protein